MGKEKIKPYRLSQIFSDGRNLLTRNLTPGKRVYGEELIEQDGIEYRVWNPRRSKLAALILKGSKTFPFESTSRVLYLGASTGTTSSHISDIVVNGLVYCVELSHHAFRKLINVCEQRKNMVPILADANRPERYAALVDAVDVLYQDVAQRNQVSIFLKNIRFLRNGGFGYLMVKARSEDVSARPKSIYNEARKRLEDYGERHLRILDSVELEPYERDHAAFTVELWKRP